MRTIRGSGRGIISLQLHRPLGLVLLVVLFFVFAWQFEAQGREGEEEEVKGWQLMPRIGVGLEYGGFLQHDDFSTSRLHRRLELDAIQYGPHIIYLEFDENTLLGTEDNKWNFNQLRYRILGGYRYDFGEHYLGIFFNHWCFNNFLTGKNNGQVFPSQTSLYFITLEFMKKSLRLGMKDRDIVFDPNKPFEFLGRLHYGAWISKETGNDHEKFLDLGWVFRGQLRYDLFRYRRLVPYLEAEQEMSTAPSVRVSPQVEVGIRCHIRDNWDLTPFLQWSRTQETLLEPESPIPYKRVAPKFLYAGLRAEVLLDSGPGLTNLWDGWQFLPEIHGSMGYFDYLKSRFYGWGGDIDLDLELLRYGPWTLFLYNELKVDTKVGGFGLDKGTPRLQFGLTYAWRRYFIEGVVDNWDRLDFRTFNNISERAHLAGLQMGTQAMKPGHFNDGISFAGPQTFQWLNKWEAQGRAGHFFQDRDWQYLWNLGGQVRWDVLRWYFVVPYLQGEVNWMSGGGNTNDAVEYAVEPGLRFHGSLDLLIYYRFQHKENARYFRGPADDQSMFGIKALF